MPWNDEAKAVMHDALLQGPLQFASLHTDYDAAGGNEISGGSPAYARQSITFGANSGGSSDSSNAPVFDVPGGSTSVAFYGLWSAVTGGTFYGMFPLGGASANNPKLFFAEESNETITSPAHGFSDGDTVVVFGENLPAGLSPGVVYYVRDSTTDTFALAATSGGAAIDLTADGLGIIQAITVETFAAQGQFTLSDVDLSGNLVT